MAHTIKTDLIEAGFVHTHYPADFYDDGNGESGPHLVGHRDYEEYVDGECYIFFEDDAIVHIAQRDHKEEAYLARMEEAYNTLWDGRRA